MAIGQVQTKLNLFPYSKLLYARITQVYIIMLEFLYKPAIIAPPDYNRWLMAPCAVGLHICIGSVYAWSLINPLLTKRVGVVASSADDWLLSDAVLVFTIAVLMLGLTAAVAGSWLEKVGPRMCGTVASFCWAGGFVVSAIGIEMGALWMIYLGYGIIGGMGLGLGYVTPVSTEKIFLERKKLSKKKLSTQ